MPTSQIEVGARAHTILPDIFRTINGVDLDIGPMDRMRDVQNSDGAGGLARTTAPSTNKSCPRIILRDALGHELDTFTALQEAIYRAKWRVKESGQAKTPLEWRLPKAPPPARPDLTRSLPPIHNQIRKIGGDRSASHGYHSNVLEFDVEDVGFVQESLQLLPYAPSLSFLRQEFLVGPKTYFQIVGTVLLHKKILTETEKRKAVYNFPGFCSGCVRTGLCYGCERSTLPHFHEDKPVRTGGGYTYYKKDRPDKEIRSKHPANWKIHVNHPDEALKILMEDYAGVDLEGDVPEEIRKHLDQHGGHRERLMSSIPNFAEEMARHKQNHLMENEKKKDSRTNSDEHTDDLNRKYQGQGQRYGSSEGHRGRMSEDGTVGLGDVDIEFPLTMRSSGQGDHGGEGHEEVRGQDYPSNHGDQLIRPDTDDYAYTTSEVTLRSKGGKILRSEPTSSDDDSDQEASAGKFTHRLPKVRKTESDDEDEEEREENEKDSNSKTSRGRQRQKLYKAPPPFKLKKSPSRKIQSKSPFSTNRSYDLPKGKVFEVKKSSKAPTEFKEFRNVDVGWKEPKKFELKKTEHKTTKFWSGPKNKKSDDGRNRKNSSSRSRSPLNRKLRRVPSPRAVSPDSGLDSEFLTDSTIKSELEPLREETLTPSPEPQMDRLGTPTATRLPTPERPKVISPQPEPTPTPQPPKRREIVKKEKKVKPRSPSPPPKPQTPVQIKSPTPEPKAESPAPREISVDLSQERNVPDLPPIEIPALPELEEKKSEYKGTKKERKLIEVTPELPPEKKKLPGPPKLAPRYQPKKTSRKTKVAEAPVTSQELQQLKDPLDFLAKYCIINPDRLPFYERVFDGAVSFQTPRYSRDPEPARGGALVQLPPAQLSANEINMLRDITVLTQSQTPRREGISAPEQYLEKLNYSIEFIKEKQFQIQDSMHKLQVEKLRLMANMAKEMDRDIVRLDYKTKGKKKKKKKKKKKADVPDYDTMGAMGTDLKNFQPRKASDITDEVIVSRMDDKMLKKAKKDPEVKKYMLEIGRDLEKLKQYNERIAQIEDEKDLVGLYCMDYYFSEQVNSSRPQEFLRQQSRLYQKLHPDPDVEMNIEEVEAALQQVNNRLLSEKEFQYIYFILDLPKREKINFRLFSIIAAMSEKVTQMDPVIKKLLNKVDYNALDVKMDRSKELFELLQDEDILPLGNAPAENLAVELTAGGLTPEHTNYVMSKFNRDGKGFIDFLDFVTYVPLFVEIHKRIIEDPFNDVLDV